MRPSVSKHNHWTYEETPSTNNDAENIKQLNIVLGLKKRRRDKLASQKSRLAKVLIEKENKIISQQMYIDKHRIEGEEKKRQLEDKNMRTTMKISELVRWQESESIIKKNNYINEVKLRQLIEEKDQQIIISNQCNEEYKLSLKQVEKFSYIISQIEQGEFEVG